MTALQLLLGALTLVANYFFVGGEFALISVRRSQIEPRADAGDRRARTVMWGLEHVSAMLATAQLGITVSSLVLGAVAEPAIAHLLQTPFEALGMPEHLIHPVSFVDRARRCDVPAHADRRDDPQERRARRTGDQLPTGSSHRSSPSPAPSVRSRSSVNAVSNAILRLLNVEPRDEVNSVFTGDELSRMVQDSADHELLDERRTELLQDALELDRRPLSEVVTPTPDVVFASPDITPDQLEQLVADDRLLPLSDPRTRPDRDPLPAHQGRPRLRPGPRSAVPSHCTPTNRRDPGRHTRSTRHSTRCAAPAPISLH